MILPRDSSGSLPLMYLYALTAYAGDNQARLSSIPLAASASAMDSGARDMSEQSEITAAAATGAAAAVEAVQEQQEVEATATEAATSAMLSEARSEEASEAATEAVAVAASAGDVASMASEQSQVATEIAFDAQARLADMDDKVNRVIASHSEVQSKLDQFLAAYAEEREARNSNEVQRVEVSATHAPESGKPEPGGSSSVPGRRHKFGKR